LALYCASAQAQDTPQPPPAQQNPPPAAPEPQKKDASGNPAQAAADKTKDVTIQAAEATKKLGEQALFRLRDWENGWFTGPFAGQRRTVPLTNQQRQYVYLQQTLTTPSAYVKRMLVAGIDQARNSPSQWGQGWGAYGERFASREGQFISANSLAALGNYALKYEPLYDLCACKGFRRRTQHAILRNFVTYDETEREIRPQWALYGGAFGGGAISTAWRPHPRNAWKNGGYAVLGQAGYGALLNFFTEFAGEINRKIGARKGR
jgi:hypothetical protein